MKASLGVICFILLASYPASVAAMEIVVVDIADTTGSAQACASGFLSGPRDSVPRDLIRPLKPSSFRDAMDAGNVDARGQIALLDSIGSEESKPVYFSVQLSDGFWKYGVDSTCVTTGVPDTLYPGGNEDLWNCWADSLAAQVEYVVDSLKTQYLNTTFHYYVWNEPNIAEFWIGD